MPLPAHLEKAKKEQSYKAKLAEERAKRKESPFSNSKGIVSVNSVTDSHLIRSDGNGGKYIVFHC